MLKNPKKADLDKDGQLSSYERKRGMAIEKNMKAKNGKMMTFKQFVKDKRENDKIGVAEEKNLKKDYLKMIRSKKVGVAQEAKLMGASKGKEAKMKIYENVAKKSLIGKGSLKKKSLGGDIKKIKAKQMMKAKMGMEVKGYGQARSKDMGLQDESIPMKDNSYIKDLI